MANPNPKEIVRRFNAEVIEAGSAQSFADLMAPDFVNHSAPPGSPNGPESMWNTFENLLRPAISELRVKIEDQIAEGDMVTTRKSVTGILTGRLLGAGPTNALIAIDVIDIVRVRDGRYAEHWGMNNLAAVVAAIRGNNA
ncbi:MAG: ester cyclase [Mesorhizobium sp.]|uniref:ester cyclase n=1 Tax=Mesorhizobium sp. TaxID=1871066 RepID=UPI000FE66891|nr:ester cyclase [Mesorhizobium sp.]RWL75856.1 MAG: ester cyclase [Mesorhizobium sp.]RWL80954.1 MAG: ester cyclase [Mesorhizobium sp.]RWL89767.1 MAG: ester cyclase [Mesorhizobium sp.]RWL96422.1 MAG: ester cyclase [Mesorhizobium sp.]TIP45286.1 MAG: ester cyclase [Mesorhizobium sp.]